MMKLQFQHNVGFYNPVYSDPEELLWKGLHERFLRYRFKRKCRIQGTLVSFYCSELRLILEIVDGMKETSWEQELLSSGYRLITFTSNQVIHEQPFVLEQLFIVCLQLSSPT